MRHRLFVLIILSLIVVSSFAFADTDLFYCNSEKYLAYDVRGGIASADTKHELRIVKYPKNLQSPDVFAVPIPNGQVHRLTCQPKHIAVIQYEGAPTDSYVEYTIRFKGSMSWEIETKKLGKQIPLTESEPPTFRSEMGMRNRLTAPIDLPPSAFKLVLLDTQGVECKEGIVRKVVLRSPAHTGSQDFKLFEFSQQGECRE